MHKFTVGSYEMRNGWTAQVKYIIPEPCSDVFVLCGYYYDEIRRVYQSAFWTANGKTIRQGEHKRDLLPPQRVVYLPYYPNTGEYGRAYETQEIAENEANKMFDFEIIRFVEPRTE